MPCQSCESFCRSIKITRSGDLNAIIENAWRAVAENRLVIDSGDLQWFDYMECRLHCQLCGQNFSLNCETYHGSGGDWTVGDSTG
jgi:hypothetical protein